LAYPDALAADYKEWIEVDEGYNNEHSAFGFLQAASVLQEQLSFVAYPTISDTQCRTSYKLLHQAQQKREKADVYVYVDGGFLNNRGGTGVYITDQTGNCIFARSRTYYPVHDPYHVEAIAFRDGLHDVSLLPAFEKARKIAVLSDCSKLTSYIPQWCKQQGHYLTPLQNEIINLLDIEEGEFLIKSIPGHSGIVGNQEAHDLATDGLRASQAIMIPVEREFFLKKGSTNLLEKTEDEGSSFNFISRLSLPPSFFKRLSKFDRQIQLTLNRLLSNHYRHRFAWTSAPPTSAGRCPHCYAQVDDANHFTWYCLDPRSIDARVQYFSKPQIQFRSILFSPHVKNTPEFFSAIGVQI
jgi:ribonuclease HI